MYNIGYARVVLKTQSSIGDFIGGKVLYIRLKPRNLFLFVRRAYGPFDTFSFFFNM